MTLLTPLRAGLAPGRNVLLEGDGSGVDLRIHLLQTNETLSIAPVDQEVALVVLRGEGQLLLATTRESARTRRLSFARLSWIDQGPSVAHVPPGMLLDLLATRECEVAEIATANALGTRAFAPRVLGPAELPLEYCNQNRLQHTAHYGIRAVPTVAGSHLVLAEVLTFPGRWSRFPPQRQREPEACFYRFYPEQGYGCVQVDDQMLRVQQHDLLRLDGQYQSHVAAPGYHMGYLSVIRQSLEQPFGGPEAHPDHAWVLD